MSAFEDFVRLELPLRVFVLNDPAQESIPVRRGNGPRQLEFIDLNDGDVITKQNGVITNLPASSLTTSTTSFVYTENTPSLTWSIPHNQDSEDFLIQLYDDTNNIFYPDNVNIIDTNNVEVTFNANAIGKAILIFAS